MRTCTVRSRWNAVASLALVIKAESGIQNHGRMWKQHGMQIIVELKLMAFTSIILSGSSKSVEPKWMPRNPPQFLGHTVSRHEQYPGCAGIRRGFGYDAQTP